MTSRVFVYASIATFAAAPGFGWAGAPVFQGSLRATINGPRAVAATHAGDLYVVDASDRLHRLTRRGESVGTLIGGVTSVVAAGGVVLAATRDRGVVHIDPNTGRALRRFTLGTSEPPVALAYDEALGKLWVAFPSGLLQARTLQGAMVHEVPPGSTGVSRLSGLSVDRAGTVWALQDRVGGGRVAIRGYDAATGRACDGDPAACGGATRSVSVPVKIAGGLSADASGRLFVSDMFSGTVQIVEQGAATGASFGKYGSRDGELLRPAGMAQLANGDVVVANMDLNRLDRFGSGAPLPTCAGDADCDGLPDDWEAANGLDPSGAGDPLADRDGDGLNTSEEYALGTNPRAFDSDGDGFGDGEELATGFDPRDGQDHLPQVMADAPSATDPGYVRLSASVRDPLGTAGSCSVKWRQTSGVPVTLKGATTPSASFVARAAGAYGFEASGTCGAKAAIPAQVQVAVNNVAPRADGGRIVTLSPGARLDLSAQFTTDANGDVPAFQWDQVLGPPVAGSVAGGNLGATLASEGYYVFRLGATDPAGAEGAAEVPVLVIGDAPAPTAVAASPVRARVGEAVVLDASGSHRGAGAAFAWAQVAGPAVTLEGAASERASFTPSQQGRYAFDVAVEDAGLRSPPARVEVYVAAAGAALPQARASAPSTATVDSVVTLDGSASSGTGGLTYAWRQVSGPSAGLTRADRATATVVLFERGTYEFELAVADAVGTSVPAKVRVDARTRSAPLPVAIATAPATATAGDLVFLDGRTSTGATRYRWTQVEGPWVAVEQGAVAIFRPVIPGLYGFELQVDDGTVRSAPFRVNVTVF